MKLRQLFEAHHKATAAFCFGRFNPAHQGHAGVWDAVAKAGHKWYIGTNPTTIGADDPLPFNVKSAWMQAIDPRIKGHIVGETSALTLASKIYSDIGDGHYVNYITDEKDWAWSGKLLKQYNGVQGDHGYYNFKDILHVMSPRVTSASDLRKAVRAGDMAQFYQLAGTNPKLTVNGKHYYDTVQEYLLPYKAAEEEKARLKAEKAQAKADKERLKAEKAAKKLRTSAPVAEPVVQERNSIKYANKVLREMRANQFVKEGSDSKVGKGGTKPIDSEKKTAMKNTSTIPGLNMATGSMYKNYRMGIALAGAPDYPTKMEADNWIGGDPLISSYTEEEYEMVKAAALQVGAGTIENWSGKRSEEMADVNKTSTVASPKKNKYGI